MSPIALLREPKRRLLPGPVPAPPRAPLPPYPPADLAVLNRSNNYSNSGSSSSSTTSKSAAATSEWAGDAAYNAAAETYNAEARHIFQDWTQWACPNWRPVIIRLGPKAIQRVVDAFHDAKTANAANSLEMADPGLAALLAMGLEVKEVSLEASICGYLQIFPLVSLSLSLFFQTFTCGMQKKTYHFVKDTAYSCRSVCLVFFSIWIGGQRRH